MEVDGTSSFALFVYPFRFQSREFETRIAALDAACWAGREGPLRVWEEQEFHTEDLLPYVARYLNPGVAEPPTARLWGLDSGALQSTTGGLGNTAQWRLALPKRSAVSFSLDSVQLALFCAGVGFLSVRVCPTTSADPRRPSSDVADWLNFLHYFRFVRGQRDVSVAAQRRTGKDERAPFFPAPAGGEREHPEGRGCFADVLDALLKTGARDAESPPWWSEVFIPGQMLPFAALYADQVPDEEKALLVYRVRNFFHAEQVIHPSPQELRLDDHPGLLPYVHDQWFTFSLDGGAFVACNAPRTSFFREELPSHLRGQYYLLFVLALHQRFTLMSLSDEVAKNWSQERARASAFEGIRDTLLLFTARGYFAQVMQQEHHHRCYTKWQERFQLDRLYQEVRDEIQDMYNELLLRAQEAERRQRERLELIIAAIGVPALLASFLGINLRGVTTSSDGIEWWAAALGMLGAIIVGMFLVLKALPWFVRRQEESSSPRAAKGKEQM